MECPFSSLALVMNQHHSLWPPTPQPSRGEEEEEEGDKAERAREGMLVPLDPSRGSEIFPRIFRNHKL